MMEKVLLNRRVFLILAWTFITVYTNIASNGVATAAAPKSKGPIPTSSYSVQRWASQDIASNIEKFIKHEEKRLRIITNFSGYEDEVPFVKRRLSEFKIIHKDLVKNETAKDFKKSLSANHPTTIFAALRNFVAAWENKTANATIYGKRLPEFLEANDTKPLPTRKDLNIAGTGLTVIQATYNLSMADLLKGDVMGQKGEPLSPADCYDIGKSVIEAGLLDTAHEWFEAAVNSIGKDLDKVHQEHLTFNLSDALSALAKIAYKKKDQGKALKLFEKAVELDPDNPAVYQDYVKHRFGRDVDPISELDREKVEPWRKKFFDMCKNSTNATWLEENRKLLATNMKCRLRPSRDVPYRLYKEEILSKSPYISIILDFMSDKEVRQMKNATLHELKKTILPGNDASTMWQFKGGYFRDTKGDVLKQVSERVGDATGLNVSQSKNALSLGEPIHIIDYGIAGLALPHGEFLKVYNQVYMRQTRGKRHATMQVYLSDVTLGGATVFIGQNITIIPKKGMAVLWYNFMPSGEPETSLYIGTCPLAVGENIVLEKGIWRLNTDATLLCGRKQKSTHLTVSMIQTFGDSVCDTPSNDTEANDTEKEDIESDDSEKEATETKGSETEDSEDTETNDSEEEDVESDDSEKKDTATNDSEEEDTESDDSETEDTETNDSEKEDAESDDSGTNDSEKEDAKTSDTEKGDTEKSDTEKGDTETSENEDSEASDTVTNESEKSKITPE